MESKKKVLFISYFNHYHHRFKFVNEAIGSEKIETFFVFSSFNHITKKQEVENNSIKNFILIKSLPYKRNLSIIRIISYLLFSIKALTHIKSIKPDIIYCSIPPNILGFILSRFKSRYKFTLIFDLYDLWPESIPYKKIKNILKIPFFFWSYLRNSSLKYCDYLITECNTYIPLINKYSFDVPKITIYPISSYTNDIRLNFFNKNTISFLFIGSINHLIDVNTICNLLIEFKKFIKVELHIIGGGVNTNSFLKLIKENDINYFYYGIIFESDKINNIVKKCNFGLNIIKSDVVIGLTLKSKEYINFGLPIINNLSGETSNLISKYNCGYNIESNNINLVVSQILSLDKTKYSKLISNTIKLKNEFFTFNSFSLIVNSVFKNLL